MGASNQRRNKGDFAQGSVASNVLRMAGPMTLAQIITVLYNMVDRMYIGRLPDVGRLALTGIGICAPAISIIIAFANLCGIGGGPLFSQARGRGEKEEAGTIMGNAFGMLLIFGVILTFVSLIVKTPLLYWLGADETTFPYAKQYFSIYLFGTISVMISLGMNPFVNAQGSSNYGMMTVAIGAVVNIILDPILIFARKMGVQGAALATVIAQTVSALWVLLFLTRKNALVRLQARKMKLQGRVVGRIASLGASGFMLSFTNSLVQRLYNTQLRELGGTMYVSVMTIINSVRDIVFAGVNGLTSGASPVVAYNYGAKRYDRVREAIRFVTIGSLIYCVVAWAAIQWQPAFFIRIFNNDPELIPTGTRCFHVYFACIFAMGLQLTGQMVSMALGRAKTAMFVSLLRKVILVAPLIFILPRVFGLGVDGVLMAEPISNVVGGLACYLTMYFTVYRGLKQLEEKAPDLPE